MFKKFICLILVVSCSSFVFSCATVDDEQRTTKYFISESEFAETLDHATVNHKSYEGLQATTEIVATLINTKVRDAQVKKQAMVLQWSDAEFNNEMDKKIKDSLTQTEVFVSFFSPEKAHEDLGRSKTLWKIYLETDGRRFEGKAEKIKLLASEIQNIFPEHSRFATPYRVIFPVPVTSVEQKESVFTITGPIGTTTFKFAALK